MFNKNIFSKISNLKTKSFTAFIFLIGTTCLFFFMNCANEEPIILDGQFNSQSNATTTSQNGNTPFPTLAPSDNSDQNTNCPTPPPGQLNIVQQVAAKTGDLYKTDVAEFTESVAECLEDSNSNWGRRLDTVGVLANDTVAYYMGENTKPYSVNIVDRSSPSNPQLVWSVQGTDTECGQVGGTWQGVNGDNCVLNEEEEEEEEEQCTQSQLANGYATINGQCLKKCNTFASTNAQGVSIGKGQRCNDTANYNILMILNTYESQLDEPQTCCRMSSRTNCASNYTKVNGVCRPSCQQAAQLSGYTTNYYLYTNGCYWKNFYKCTKDCGDLSHDGHKDWLDFSFYDPYNFMNVTSNVEGNIYFSGDRSGCCVRASQDSQARDSYDANGWHPNDHISN